MWTANLFEIVTGAIGPSIDFENMSWSVSLNETENFSLEVRKSALPKVDYSYWMAPWYAGVVLMWEGVPIVAGPIISRPHESFDVITLECSGIRALLARRYVVPEINQWNPNIARAVINAKGISLGSHAATAVRYGTLKMGGSLPIEYPVPYEYLGGKTHERNYRGFNIQNLSVDDILTKLSNVMNGPDIMFKPRLVDANSLIFDMWHGNNSQPRIPQKKVAIWDTTAPMGGVVDAQVIMTASEQTSRVYSIGAGTDESQIITVHTNNTPLQKGFPILESVVNMGNSENKAVVSSHGVSRLSYNASMKQQLQITVDGNDPVNQIGSFWPGDLVRLNVEGWISLPDGITDYRLLNMNGDSSGIVKLSLQPESQFTAEDVAIAENEGKNGI